MSIQKPRFTPRHARAVCPGCTQRAGHLVTDDCPVCLGAGTIVLGLPALVYDPPEVVSRAIWIVLESAANSALLSDDRGQQTREVLPATVDRLVRLGLIERPEGARP